MKTVVLTFGRFNPPTKGHELLFRAMHVDAQKRQADVIVFLSNTTDRTRNPLTRNERQQLIKRAFPTLTIGPESVNSPNEALTWAKKQGYTRVVMVTGEDRREDFKHLIAGWNRVVDPKHDVAVTLTTIPRDETTASGTAARQQALDNDLKGFRSNIISSADSPEIAKRLVDILRLRLTPDRSTLNMSMKTFGRWLKEAGEAPDPKQSTQAGMGGPADGEPPADEVPEDDTPSAEEPVSDDELPLDSTLDDGRVSSDTPEHQAQLVLHPSLRLKKSMINNYKLISNQRKALEPKY